MKKGKWRLSSTPIKRVFQFTTLSLAIFLIGGGIALLCQLHQVTNVAALSEEQRSTYQSLMPKTPADLSVAGSPSLPATTIDAIFKRLGSPMLGTGKVVEQVSRQSSIDDAFALAVWWTETNDGAAGVGRTDFNPGGVRGSIGYPSAYDGYTIYPSYAAAINDWFHLLRNNYVNRGLRTVYAISHPYVGTSSAPLWAGKVIALMLRYRGEAPPLQPTPTPPQISSPTVSASMLRHEKMELTTDATLATSGSQDWPQQMPLSHNGAVSQTNFRPALSPQMQWAIIAFGLLTALIIALWSLSIERSVGAVLAPPCRPCRKGDPSTPASNTAFSTPTPRLAGRNFPVRRTILLPSLPDTRVPGSETIVRRGDPRGYLPPRQGSLSGGQVGPRSGAHLNPSSPVILSAAKDLPARSTGLPGQYGKTQRE